MSTWEMRALSRKCRCTFADANECIHGIGAVLCKCPCHDPKDLYSEHERRIHPKLPKEPPPMPDIPEPPLHQLPGGATRSEKKPGYHMVPTEGLRRTALRFDLGAEKHGADNWKRSTIIEHEAYSFCVEAYNHMLDHIMMMRDGMNPEDDHLGAIGWAQSVLCYVEHQFGKRWTDLRQTEEIPF